MLERIAVHADADVRLVGGFRVHLHLRAVASFHLDGVGATGLRLFEVAEQLMDAIVQAVADLSADADGTACTSGRRIR